MPSLPSGTVTFLFSDIEGSTELLKRLGDRYAKVLSEHRRVLRASFGEHGGREIDTQGDAFFYAFPRARAAVVAAVDADRKLETSEWPDGVTVRVRIGLHTGEPTVGEEGYTGLDVVREARIGAIAHGGQMLLSETTAALVGTDLPEDVSVRALRPRKLKGIDQPERVFTIVDSTRPQPSLPESDVAAELPSESADRARTLIEERVLADLERAVADAKAGKGTGWSDTVRWVLVTLIIAASVAFVAIVAIGVTAAR